MKSTGVVRKIDELGRIVIPKELRRTLEINEGDPIEFFTEGNKVVIQKYEREPVANRIADLRKLLSNRVNFGDISGVIDLLEEVCKK